MSKQTDPLSEIRTILDGSSDRATKTRRIAEVIRAARTYRWVGIYDVGEEEISVLAWSGASAPTHPRFPITQGLNGAAVASRETIMVNDVASDPRYLKTFGSTQSEIVVPIIDPDTGAAAGTIDAESDTKNAFSESDKTFLEDCARVMIPLWR